MLTHGSRRVRLRFAADDVKERSRRFVDPARRQHALPERPRRSQFRDRAEEVGVRGEPQEHARRDRGGLDPLAVHPAQGLDQGDRQPAEFVDRVAAGFVDRHRGECERG